jgi:hypothetical protein
VSFFTRGFLGGITGANARRRKKGLAYDAEIKGPDQTDLGSVYDTASLGAARWKPRQFSTIYQSKKYKEGRRVFADSITAPTVYGGPAVNAAPSGLSSLYGGAVSSFGAANQDPYAGMGLADLQQQFMG